MTSIELKERITEVELLIRDTMFLTSPDHIKAILRDPVIAEVIRGRASVGDSTLEILAKIVCHLWCENNALISKILKSYGVEK